MNFNRFNRFDNKRYNINNKYNLNRRYDLSKLYNNKLKYYCESLISTNHNRDKVLYVKTFIKKLLSVCTNCGNVYKPYVEFPLMYSPLHCVKCDHLQHLIRCRYDAIPDFITTEEYKTAIDKIKQNGILYPTCYDVFYQIDVDRHESF